MGSQKSHRLPARRKPHLRKISRVQPKLRVITVGDTQAPRLLFILCGERLANEATKLLRKNWFCQLRRTIAVNCLERMKWKYSKCPSFGYYNNKKWWNSGWHCGTFVKEDEWVTGAHNSGGRLYWYWLQGNFASFFAIYIRWGCALGFIMCTIFVNQHHSCRNIQVLKWLHMWTT